MSDDWVRAEEEKARADAAERMLETSESLRQDYDLEARELTVECDRLFDQVAAVDEALGAWDTHGLVGRVPTIENLVAARAERDRLREALQTLRAWNAEKAANSGYVGFREFARAALDDLGSTSGGFHTKEPNPDEGVIELGVDLSRIIGQRHGSEEPNP